jgi:YaiO family outer membrane protein
LTKTKSTTFWLNYAYSWHDIFPNHRIILEVWQKLPANFLISGGGVYYDFDEVNAKILNLGLENYFSRYWVGFKTYFYLKDPKLTTSYSLSGRMFFKDVNFLQLTLGMGSAQDEPFLLPNDLDRLNAYSARLNYTIKTLAQGKYELRTGFTYMYEEYDVDVWRNRFAFGIGLTYNLGK